MEAVVGAASWHLGKVVTKLSDEMVASYVASLELGHNFQDIQHKLLKTQGLLHAAQRKDVGDNHGLQELLRQLSRKAEEAEGALNELHYFKIQDKLYGTDEATTQEPAQEMGDMVRAHARNTRHAARYTVGNCLRCFSCSPTQDDDCAAAHATNNPDNTTKSDNDNNGGHVDKLSFNRVAMSNKIKSVIEDIHSLCIDVSDFLGQIPNSNTTDPLTRPQIGSTFRGSIVQDTMYGREIILKKTLDDIITNCREETLSVLPIVGPGGIGKTTFTQQLYNHAMTKENFTVRVWVCVSTNFDVLELTKKILSCIPATEKEGSNTANETGNLSKLQECIAQRLKSKRFLIVLDDIWTCESKEDWEILLAPFTKEDTKGNMVVVTTRFRKLAHVIKTIDPIELQGLEFHDFFTFFEACIFGEHHKPRQYEDDLIDIAREIAIKLRGSPLAAKTAGRLLKREISREHWIGVLREWENMKKSNADDIMSSLAISYDYLPFQLQKCFSYCGLFPEDHRFNGLEINRFWIAIGIIDSGHLADRNYLEELVDNGFITKVDDDCYVMHDLMHELCQIVSAQECLNISNLGFRADAIPEFIRHVSISIEDRYDANFGEEMSKLKRRIDIANLQTLMIFREYQERIAEILKDTFEEVNGLHVLFIVVKSLDCLPRNFPKLIHLQYLKLGSPYGIEMTLPNTIFRFYHLKFLDLEDWYGSYSLPKNICHLVNLRDFIPEELLSNVPEVGKMKYLQELKKFYVKKERDGFELSELGKLTELGGTLSICNLENVSTKEEARDAQLMAKNNLKELRLVWNKVQPTINVDVLDALKPHSNLRALGIINHGGTTGPSWLCIDIWVKSLETLHLEGVSWGTLPPFGQLPRLKELSLKRISGVRQFGPDFGGVTKGCNSMSSEELDGSVVFRSVQNEDHVERVIHFPSSSSLQALSISGCTGMVLLPGGIQNTMLLQSVTIRGCGKLFSRWPMGEAGGAETMKPFPASLKKLGILSESSIQSMALLSNLTSLTHLTLQDCVSLTVDGFNPLITVNLKVLVVFNCRWDRSCPESIAAGLLSECRAMPAGSFQLEQLKVDCISAVLVAPICNLLASTLQTIIFCHDQRAKSFTEEQEKALQLLTSLQHLKFDGCGALQSLPRGLHHLSSLKELEILWCPEIRSIPEGFPISLQNLRIRPCSAEVKEQIEKLKRRNPDLCVWYE